MMNANDEKAAYAEKAVKILEAAGIDPSGIRTQEQLVAAVARANEILRRRNAQSRQELAVRRNSAGRLSQRARSAELDRLRSENAELLAAVSSTPHLDEFNRLTGARQTAYYRSHRAELKAESFDAAREGYDADQRERAARTTQITRREPAADTGPELPPNASPVKPRRRRA